MHPEIENLINMALADGEVTEKERAIILRKAESFGIDKDEVEMILEAKLHIAEESASKQIQEKSKSQKYGELKKCPACGAAIRSFVMNCPDCGHEFRNVEANQSIAQLEQKISKIKRKDDILGYENKIAIIINNHPIPTSKEDLFENISYMSGKVITQGKSEFGVNEIANAYHARTLEMINKLLFMPDISPNIIERVKIIEKKMTRSKSKNSVKQAIMWIFVFGVGIAAWYFIYKLFKLLS